MWKRCCATFTNHLRMTILCICTALYFTWQSLLAFTVNCSRMDNLHIITIVSQFINTLLNVLSSIYLPVMQGSMEMFEENTYMRLSDEVNVLLSTYVMTTHSFNELLVLAATIALVLALYDQGLKVCCFIISCAHNFMVGILSTNCSNVTIYFGI